MFATMSQIDEYTCQFITANFYMSNLKKLYKEKVLSNSPNLQDKKYKSARKLLYLILFTITILVVCMLYNTNLTNLITGVPTVKDESCILYVNIQNGSGHVYLDGEVMGSTPLQNYHTACGKREIKVEKSTEYDNFYYIFEESIELKEHVTTTIDLDLGPDEKSSEVSYYYEEEGETALYIFSQPRNSDIYIDDIKSSDTPITFSNISEGEHTIRIESDGYSPKEIEISVKSGYSLTINCRLAVIPIEYE